MMWGPRGRAATVLVCLALVPAATAFAADGRKLYLQHCAPCHGASGRGDGPDAAWFAPPPRNLFDGVLTQSSTADLVRRIRDGRALTLDVPAMRARAADVETLVVYLQRLPDIDWRTADAGAVIYIARCEPCHGATGHPGGSLPPGVRTPRDLSDPAFQRSVSDADLSVDVRHGRAAMPALTPRLSAAESEQVTVFVRLLSPGFATYSQYCAGCHGDHGIPAGSFAESIPAPTVVFDRAYFAHNDPEALRSKVWHMLDEHQPSMPHLRTAISEAQAQAIVGYLKREAARTPSTTP